MLKIVENDGETEVQNTLDEIAREGARRMLRMALEEEVIAYIERAKAVRDENGHRVVVRNGYGKTRKVTCGAGTFEVQAPRVEDKRLDEEGNKHRFYSRILPPYMRRSPKISEVLPVLYLRGLSTGDFKEALPILLGKDAAGLSATQISRLTHTWENDYKAFRAKRFDDKQYVYVWADGIHFNVRLEDDRLCVLVLMGVTAQGHKEVIAIEEGYRESTESWSTLMRDLKARGLQAPVLAIGDGALGFWGAVRCVWPETKQQRDWCHKLANVLDKLPKRLQGKAKEMLHEVMYAEDKASAQKAINHFSEMFSSKYEKAVNCLLKDQEKLLTFYDFPAEHWKHIRTSNVIESTFATVRLRQRVTKGAGNRKKAHMMAFKLLEMAQKRWRRLSAPELLPLVLQQKLFVDGVLVSHEENKIAA